MNLRRILLISVVALAIICSCSIVCAGESPLNGWHTVNFDGFNFNIPNGYQEISPNESGLHFAELNLSSGMNIEYKVFRNTNKNCVVISVLSGPNNLTLNNADDIYYSSYGPFSNKTVNGKPGLTSQNNRTFLYVEDGKIICVHPWNENIENIIVK